MKLHEWQDKKKEEPWVKPQPCTVCGKVTPGAYGMWRDGWSCSKLCEEEVVKRKEVERVAATRCAHGEAEG